MCLEVLSKFTKENNCDVVLTTIDQVFFSCIQRARNENKEFFQDLPLDLQSKAQSLAKNAIDGKLALFIGKFPCSQSFTYDKFFFFSNRNFDGSGDAFLGVSLVGSAEGGKYDGKRVQQNEGL